MDDVIEKNGTSTSGSTIFFAQINKIELYLRIITFV